MSRASLVRYSCPERVKPIFPMTHRPCLISSWVMSTVSEIQWATGSGPGPAKSAPRIVRGGRPQSQSLFGNPRWISSISSLSLPRGRSLGSGLLVHLWPRPVLGRDFVNPSHPRAIEKCGGGREGGGCMGRWCMNRNWPATNPTHRSITYQERTTMAYRARPSG